MIRSVSTLSWKLATPVFGVIAAITCGLFLQAQPDPDRVLYDNDELFAQLSSGGQTRLILKFGQKPGSVTPQFFGLFGLIMPTLAPVAAPTNVAVNNPAADTTNRDTQSETSLVLGAGSTIVVGYNDSGSTLTAPGNHFTGYAVSTNGGTSFVDKGTLPTTANGDAGDPVLARDTTTGVIYFVTLMFSGSGLQCFRSTDNGQTFNPPVNCAPGTSGFQDKPWLTVDNYAGAGRGNVYVVWRDFGSGNGIKISRSTDGGATYGPSGGQLLASGGAFNVQLPWVVVGPDHAVYVFWIDQSAGGGTQNILKVRKSTDQGLTFSAAVNVKVLNTTGVNGNLSLNGGLRSGAFPQAVVNPTNASQLYLVYNDCSSTPCGSAADHADVYLTRSTDGGATWQAPTKVNDDATTRDQFFPAVAITPNGQNLFVSWYDRRNSPTNTRMERFGVLGSIGGGGAVTFQANQVISTADFPVVIGQDPVVNPVYMGDYDQVVADNTRFCLTWGDNRNGNAFHANQPDVLFAQVPVCAAPTVGTPTASPNVIWPPNNKFVDVTVNYTVTASCPANCTLSVSSNEPGPNQWIIVDANHVQLKADRDGNGTGRIYTITVTCTNSAGTTQKTVTVTVPHDQR